MNTFKKLSLAAALLASLVAQVQAQTPDWQSISSSFKYVEKGTGKKVVIAAANIKTGVSLERLSLFSGEGNTEKKIFSGLLAGAASLAGVKGDFASREPIEEHLKQEDAEKIAAEALEMLSAKLKAAGLDVQGPKIVAEAPFYPSVKGEVKTRKTTDSQEGGIFKKGYFYGIYETPVAGLKFRDVSGFELMNTDLYSNANQVAGSSGAIDMSLGIVNDKSTLSLTNFTFKVYLIGKGTTKTNAYFTAILKNGSAFSVPSGGKDTLAYWEALKPKIDILFEDVSKRMATAYAEE